MNNMDNISTSTTTTTTTITITTTPNIKKVVRKSFRLFDFNIYDHDNSADIESDEGSGDENHGQQKWVKNNDQLTIQMFGVNEKGETFCVYIPDYQPFFYIKVADNWTDRQLCELLQDIRSKIDKRYKDCVLNMEFVQQHKLYGFSGGKKHKFIKITFQNVAAMNKVKNMWYIYPQDGGERVRIPFVFQKTSLELYESNIPPLLRYFHIHNISPSGWVSFKLNRVIKATTKTTTCKYEFTCPLAELISIPEKETRVPYKICSFDIEASSSHGDFPLPKKNYKRLAMNLVDVFIKQRNFIDADKSKILLQKIIMSAFNYDKFENVDLVYPKEMPTKIKVASLTRILIEKSIQSAKSSSEVDNTKLLKIDEIFTPIEDGSGEGGGGCENGDGEDDIGDGGDGEAAAWVSAAAANKKVKNPKVEKKATILDVLMSEKYTREEKIQISNEVLTSLFPHLEGDKVTFIGSTFLRYGDQEPYLNHCVVLGSCDPVENATIECADTERDLLLKWTELIQQENPDIIIGYNIFGFDYEFLFRRSQETECTGQFMLLSRKIGEMCAKTDRKDPSNELTIENTKMQIASGEYDLRYFKMSGRLQIDMYAYFRRDFNLSSYKLDDVAGEYIGDTIKKMVCCIHEKHGDVTELYSSNLMGLHVGDYIHIEITGFTADYYKSGQKFRVLDIRKCEDNVNVIVIGGHENIDIGKKSVKWGTAKDDVSPQDIFRLANGTSADRAIVAKYCIQDCNLVHHLMNKIDVITGYVEMARICSVPISFLVFRGQGIKLTSFVAKKCREKNTLMPDLEKTENADGYEGAIVLPPKCSMYMDNPVACVDYSSLYPSSMISQNYSHDSKVWTKEYNLLGEQVCITGERDKAGNFIYDNLPGYDYIDIEFDTYKYIRKNATSRAEKTKVGKIICRWAQLPDNQKSIMPSILEELLKARSTTRKMIKTEKDPFMQNILDKRQLGYKVTANSLYGQCGSRTSTFYEKDVAASTTATGRMMIIYAKRIIEEVYGNMEYDTVKYGPVLTKAEYVYGDSVASWTPVYVRINGGSLNICTIEELAVKYGGGLWVECMEEGKQDKEFCELDGVDTWSDKGWTKLYRVIRHVLAPHKKMMRILTHTGMVDVTDDHSLLLMNGNEVSPNDVCIGTELLHHPLPPDDAEIVDQTSELQPKSFIRRSQINAAKTYLREYNTFGPYSTVDVLNNRAGYSINNNGLLEEIEEGVNSNAIKRIEEISYDGYVYDLTTENHHFAAGIGNMIVHNTDSVFFTFNLENPKTGEKIRGKDALDITIEIAQDAAHLCSQWLKAPMELSYEKTLMPFILLSKKRYVGMLYETDPNKGKLKYMGLSLKRRDSCDYLKDVYGNILNILMKDNGGGSNNIQAAIDYLNKSLNDLAEGKVSIDKLTITKALRSDYKNPDQIGHKVLADRIGERDPGNKPKSGERIKFVFVNTNNPKALMGEKIETPEYIFENKLKIDYTHYITNQLMKPLQQLFGLALEQIWELQGKTSPLKLFKRDVAKMDKDCKGDLEIFMKKREKLCSSNIKVLLFDKVLQKIYNERNRLQTMDEFLVRK